MTQRFITLTIKMLITILIAFNSQAFAQDNSKAPQTAQEHRERADYYRKKSAEYRKEADSHNTMRTEHDKRVAANPKATNENPHIKKMRLHCEKYSKAALNLAREAEEMATYHEIRAKELEGK